MPDSHSPSYFGENLKLVSYCPLCENKHSSTEAKILDDNDGAKLVYIKCKKCYTSVVAVVIQNALGMSSVGVITDLTSNDVLKFRQTQDISTDDVLNIHEFLAKNKKDLEKHIIVNL